MLRREEVGTVSWRTHAHELEGGDSACARSSSAAATASGLRWLHYRLRDPHRVRSILRRWWRRPPPPPLLRRCRRSRMRVGYCEPCHHCSFLAALLLLSSSIFVACQLPLVCSVDLCLIEKSIGI
ncbi:hypothetical protein PVAP13_3KG339254 [Panicum virgatum]|uniref:Uncharacterized protein n=1 Tax=Panicum virgatum TaxID=38727 RepID=A0A8T0UVJ5_PANVG|nr:hypothetical protein PVAP13_3KG339254 [Panicum virgatum]